MQMQCNFNIAPPLPLLCCCFPRSLQKVSHVSWYMQQCAVLCFHNKLLALGGQSAIKAETIIGQQSSVPVAAVLCSVTEVRKCSWSVFRVDGLQRRSLPRSYSHHISIFLLVTAASSPEGASCSLPAKLLTSWSQVHRSMLISTGCRSLSSNTWTQCWAHVIVLQGRKVPAPAGSWLKSPCQFLVGGGDVWMERGCNLCPLSCSSADHTAKQQTVLMWLDVGGRAEVVRGSYTSYVSDLILIYF